MSSAKHGNKFLKGLVEYRVSTEVETSVIREYLSALDCPRSLSVWILFAYGEHGQLAELGFRPNDYADFSSAQDAYTATKFLSKFKGLTLDYDLDKVALKKFSDNEDKCRRTNARFRHLSSDSLYKGAAVWLHHAVTRKIAQVLGPFSSTEMFSYPDWGPGASTLVKRLEASSVKKFQCETGITRDLYALIPPEIMWEVFPMWSGHLVTLNYPEFQVGNRVVTVPKDATTNRVIAIEPGINLWFQKSVGEMIRQRLLRVSIDLRDQGQNQRLACLGSKTGSVATVDLSSASDSISRFVVEEILPRDWFSVMDSCRSRFGTLDGRLMEWQKFSSMGNGFTFPLESLIFYAVAYSCAEYLGSDRSLVSVYGDDVTLPTDCFQLFSEMMSFYGFSVNEKKSHYDSPFRESCGAHFYSGFDTKPFFLKERISSIQSIFKTANAIRRLAHRRVNTLGCDSRFREVFDHLVAKVPKALRLRIPNSLGDSGFISNFDEASPVRARHYVEGYVVWTLAETSKTRSEDRFGYLLAELWRVSKRDTEDRIPDRVLTRLEAIAKITFLDSQRRKTDKSNGEGRNFFSVHSTRWCLRKCLVQQWYDLGPWI